MCYPNLSAHQGAECIQPSLPPSRKQSRLDCIHTHSSQERPASGGPAVRPHSWLFQGAAEVPRAPGTRSEVRRGHCPLPLLSKEQHPHLKVLISRGFQKSGYLDREAKFPHNLSGTSERPRHLPNFPQVTTLCMLRGDAKQPTLTWRQLCARPHVFMKFFILSSTTVKTRLAEVWL